jgi:uncharacterized protein YdeI (YjbR/CyaY-like superfamily)
MSGMTVRFFKTRAAFRAWLEKNHASAKEIDVGIHKKSTGRPSITYAEALEEALCFGWIDGVRRTIDSDSYSQRFTPRRPGSAWSLANINRVNELKKQGRMQPAGLAAFAHHDVAKARKHTETRGYIPLDPALEMRFRANKRAWSFFAAQPPGYRRIAIWWVMSAKKEDTRLRRLTTLIDDSANNLRLPDFRRPSSNSTPARR